MLHIFLPAHVSHTYLVATYCREWEGKLQESVFETRSDKWIRGGQSEATRKAQPILAGAAVKNPAQRKDYFRMRAWKEETLKAFLGGDLYGPDDSQV